MRRKSHVFWPVSLCLVLADCASKRLAVEHLGVPSASREVVGSVLRFTLAYNRGTAFGLMPGPASRAALIVLTAATLVVLVRLYQRVPASDGGQALALALIVGGAVGNLTDRVRSASGVVDFIDAGAGPIRFYIFNVADIGVTLGAALLAVLLWRRGGHRRRHTTA